MIEYNMYDMYRQSLLGDSSLRAIVAKEINKYNKQRRLENDSLFNPLLLIRDSLPFYYDYIISNIENLEQFLEKFNYRVSFHTAVMNALGNHVNLQHFVNDNREDLQLFLFHLPVDIHVLENNWGSFTRTRVGNKHIYLNDPNIYLNLHT